MERGGRTREKKRKQMARGAGRWWVSRGKRQAWSVTPGFPAGTMGSSCVRGPRDTFGWGFTFFCGLCIVETAVLEEKLLEIKK